MLSMPFLVFWWPQVGFIVFMKGLREKSSDRSSGFIHIIWRMLEFRVFHFKQSVDLFSPVSFSRSILFLCFSPSGFTSPYFLTHSLSLLSLFTLLSTSVSGQGPNSLVERKLISGHFSYILQRLGRLRLVLFEKLTAVVAAFLNDDVRQCDIFT